MRALINKLLVFMSFFLMSETFTLNAKAEIKPKTYPPLAARSNYERAKALANKYTVTVMGGGISGTNIRLVTDLANVLNKRNILRIVPVIGLGTGQNVKDILFLKGVDMGIVRSDHLIYFKKQNPALYKDIHNRISYITKLFDSEWHILAGKNIRSLEDLRGKRVNLWKPFSATGLGGCNLFNSLGINIEKVYMDTQLAIEKIRSGEIAATVIVGGAPVDSFKNLSNAQDLHFLPVIPKWNNDLINAFLPASLKHKDYPTLIPKGQEIKTISISTMLAVYNWPSDNIRYKKLEIFVQEFFQNIEKFKEAPRHPKWKNINLAARVPGWKRFEPASEYLSGLTSVRNNSIPLKRQFENFLRKNYKQKWSTLSKNEQEIIFESFLKFIKNKQ